ncbi:MAG: hypothetical protein A2X86_08955 [Bdellovibrionales bacterium GWA2_49_15]|nr:MAG: hypothetical protein A2X86_08955 [Bdellovibrionales bacterium GWA2_49_15]HAZ12906.1 hypothetical protein [Bdellovibrionales bacterium]
MCRALLRGYQSGPCAGLGTQQEASTPAARRQVCQRRDLGTNSGVGLSLYSPYAKEALLILIETLVFRKDWDSARVRLALARSNFVFFVLWFPTSIARLP